MWSKDQIESALPSWLLRVWRSPLARLAWSTPAAIAFLAGLNDIGEWAGWIVRAWSPVQAFAIAALTPLAIALNIRDGAAVLMAFFSPFVLIGVIQRAQGRFTPERVYINTISIIALPMMMSIISHPMAQSDELAGGLQVGMLSLLAYYSMIATNHLTVKSDIILSLAPLASSATTIAILSLYYPINPITIPGMLAVFSLPQLASRRLAEVALIASVIVGISRLHDGFASMVSLP